MYRKSNYKHLFFDLDNTLIDFDASAKLVLQELFTEHKLERFFTDFADFYTVYSAINKDLWHQYKDHKITKNEVKFGRFQKTLEKRQVSDETLWHTMGDSFVARVAHKHVLVPGSMEVLHALHPHYKLHIISNGFNEVQHAKLEGTGMRRFFDWVILSENVKAQKPKRLIFETALKNANARKSESLMIGDNFDTDITGAHNFGMDQAWFMYHKEYELTFEPTFTIQKLTDLLDILSHSGLRLKRNPE